MNLDNDKPTTCINAVLGCHTEPRLSREELLAEIFNVFDELVQSYQRGDMDSLDRLYRSLWLHEQQEVTVREIKVIMACSCSWIFC